MSTDGKVESLRMGRQTTSEERQMESWTVNRTCAVEPAVKLSTKEGVGTNWTNIYTRLRRARRVGSGRSFAEQSPFDMHHKAACDATDPWIRMRQ